MGKYIKKARGGIVVDLITHHHQSSGVRTRSRTVAHNCEAQQKKEKDHHQPSSSSLSVSRKQITSTRSISNYLELRSRKLEKLRRLDIQEEIKRGPAAAAAEMDLSAEGIRSCREFPREFSATNGGAFSDGFSRFSAEEEEEAAKFRCAAVSEESRRKSGEENNSSSSLCCSDNYTHPSSSSSSSSAGGSLQMNCAVDPIQQFTSTRNGNSIIGSGAHHLAMATWIHHRTSRCHGSIKSRTSAALSRNNSATRLDLHNITTKNSHLDPQTPPPETVLMQEALSPHHLQEIEAAVQISPRKDFVDSEQPKVQVSFGENALADELPALSFGGDSLAIPAAINTPGSQLPAQTCAANSHSHSNPTQLSSRDIVAAPQSRLEMEIEDFLSDAEKREHKRFVEKYNFDPVKGVPLPGRYEWFGGCN